VWWRDPFIVLPLSLSLPGNLETPEGVTVPSEDLGCDSGSFAFIPLLDDLPQSLERQIEELIAGRSGVQWLPPVGRYRVFYEQHDPPDERPSFHRNVVAQREGSAI